jgi:pimeloyl-ACP methyl ester carboxylesterase
VTRPIQYARSGDVNITYQVTGDGPFDLVLVPGFFSHLEIDCEHLDHAGFLERLGSFARLIRFDKRGTGLSDRAVGLPDFQTRMDDVRAVMDASGSEQAALFGYSEGGPLSSTLALRRRGDRYGWRWFPCPLRRRLRGRFVAASPFVMPFRRRGSTFGSVFIRGRWSGRTPVPEGSPSMSVHGRSRLQARERSSSHRRRTTWSRVRASSSRIADSTS